MAWVSVDIAAEQNWRSLQDSITEGSFLYGIRFVECFLIRPGIRRPKDGSLVRQRAATAGVSLRTELPGRNSFAELKSRESLPLLHAL